MKKKKLVALVASAIMVVTLFAGCGNSESADSSSANKDKKIKVGLSTDEGGLNDKSFNQAADTGVKKAQKEFGIDYKPIESKQKEDYESNLEALVNDNCDLTFGVGFQVEPSIKNIAEKYSDKKFVIIDPNDSKVDKKNLQAIKFKEEEGSFLMGVIAGKMTKTNKVGFIGGKDNVLIKRFEVGFAAGVKAVNPEAAKGLIGKGSEKGSMVKYADSFGDTNKGYELAKSLYGSGCDVIYHAAGGVGIGLFKAAKELTKPDKPVWAIGVDLDQSVTVPEYKDIILSSMIKKVDVATYKAIKSVIDGKFEGGKYIELGLKEDGVDIAPTSDKNTPKEVLDLVDKYKKDIKEDKFKVPATREDLQKFNAPEVK
ncbi:BMP family ABC transporter substrate-binding protein [Clostridium niameyense]|uniref:BMP family ABC transporter substrate-binding protein n=1 Tax=Clostridium niameyense TaxID=1622073 RepID=A0A6M0RA54_9CLOT|nr:BMP family ABC transporter substrate-binding protein [Clostridium niameyense]NEZ47102.1 BMP family ABC transporter substrate-binding protein [Clostridium niameyense]